jgi:ATP-dependent Clp protease protease subunit
VQLHTKKQKEGNKMPNRFWKFKNQADGGAELLLYGDIASEQSWWGDEVTPKQFAEDLAGLGDVRNITVRINSGGGDVFAAQAIGNLLEQHAATVTARIDGVCASAATIIACHCNQAIAANDSTYMVHPVRMYCGYANEAELQKYLEALATIKENIISLYAKKTGRTKDEVTAWMDAESWWTGPQAKENGFVDELTDEEAGVAYENRGGVLFVNSVSMGAQFDKAPEFVRNRVKRVVDNGPAGQPGKEQEVQDMEPKDNIKTADDLRKAYPTLVDEIEQAAAEAATNAERTRIQSIEDMALPGSEKLAAEAKYEKPMSAADFAQAMVKNAKTQGTAYLAQVQKDAENSGVNGIINTPPDDRTKGDVFTAAIKDAAGKN